jgi:hypothetical protein
MTETLDILYSITGQSLVFDAPEGRASSITSSDVYENTDGDDATAESATTGSAAVETNPNTTFDADSGDGETNPRICNLAATTGIARGRRYLATTADGEREWIEVKDIDSGNAVTARHVLSNAYANADTFESTRIAHAIDSTWVADSNNISASLNPNPRYRWRLEYVVDSVTYVHDIYFDLVRYSGTHTVTGLDVDANFPGWLDRLPTDDREDQGERIIDAAYRSVKMDLYGVLKADQMARNAEVIDDLVMHKAAIMGTQGAEDTEAAQARYEARWNHLIVQPKMQFADSQGGGAREVNPLPIFRR